MNREKTQKESGGWLLQLTQYERVTVACAALN